MAIAKRYLHADRWGVHPHHIVRMTTSLGLLAGLRIMQLPPSFGRARQQADDTEEDQAAAPATGSVCRR